MVDYILSEVEMTYPDWTGTSGAEMSMMKEANDLYALAGLDHAQWSILSVDIIGFSHGSPPDWDVTVTAWHCGLPPEERRAEFERVVSEGAIPVTEIRLEGVGMDDVVKCMKVVHIQLRARNVNAPIRVVQSGKPS